MRNFGRLIGIAVVLSLFLVSGCTNTQQSERSRAEMVVAALPDFQEQLYYFNISSGSSLSFLIFDPFVYDEYPRSELMRKETARKSFVHQIIYQTKSGEHCLVFLSDGITPKIIKLIKME